MSDTRGPGFPGPDRQIGLHVHECPADTPRLVPLSELPARDGFGAKGRCMKPVCAQGPVRKFKRLLKLVVSQIGGCRECIVVVAVRIERRELDGPLCIGDGRYTVARKGMIGTF